MRYSKLLLLLNPKLGTVNKQHPMARGAGAEHRQALLFPSTRCCSQGSSVTAAYAQLCISEHASAAACFNGKAQKLQTIAYYFLGHLGQMGHFPSITNFPKLNRVTTTLVKRQLFFFFLITAECKDDKCKYKGKNILLEQYSLFSPGEKSISDI